MPYVGHANSVMNDERAPTVKNKSLPAAKMKNPLDDSTQIARGLHPLSKQKIPQTILPESPWASEAPVGFINSRSLMDLLPSKSSAQQMTLRTTRNSWAGPNT